MKNLYKLIGIITLVAVIGFTFAACNSGGGGDGDGGGGGGGGRSSGWPPQNVRSQYGIGGLNQPPGSKFWYGTSGETILIEFTSTNTTRTYLDNWFTSNGYSVGVNTTRHHDWTKGSIYARYYLELDSDEASLMVNANAK